MPVVRECEAPSGSPPFGMPTLLVVVHIAAATVALVAGPCAVQYPNGTPIHRRIGRAYVGGWLAFASTGAFLGAQRPGVSPFEVLNALGATFVVLGLLPLWRRERFGRRWRQYHYRAMLISVAFVVVASVNQVLMRLGFEYPWWAFGLLTLSPFLVLPLLRRRLDRRYGFSTSP